MIVDYYELLGIEPGADRARVEEALARRQVEWSDRAHLPGEGDHFRGYLAQVPALRRALLGTDMERAAYDAERKRAHHGARAGALDELQRLVALRAAKGGLGVRDRQALTVEAERRGVDREALDHLMQPFPPWPEPPLESADHESLGDVPDTNERRRIRRVLDSLGRRDLYDLLDLDGDAPADEVTLRLEAALRVGVSPDAPQAAAWAEALALAQAHLGSREACSRYDRGRGADALDRLDETLGFILRGMSRLDPNTREALIQEAAALGLSHDRAERRIRAACRREGVAIEVPAGSSPPHDPRRRWLRCRSCGGLTEYSWTEIHGGGQCRHCRAALRWSCPVCQQRTWVDEAQCRCGFRQSDAEPMRVHFEAAQHAFKLRRYAEAMGHLKHVQRYAPTHVGARKGIEKLLNQVREIRRLRAAYGVERAARRMASARAIVEQWARIVSPFDAKLKAAQNELKAVLERGQELAVRAKRKVESDPAEARNLYRQALAIAADLPEAAEGLRRCPPDGPADLNGEARSGRIRLSWTSPAPDGIGPVVFRVLRKEGAAPTHADDGAHVADAVLPEFEDGPLPPGHAFGYAVFTVREGVRSLLGVATGPIVVTDEVRHLIATPKRGGVELTWRLPSGALGARVMRRPGAPVRNVKDGEAVEARRDGATDAGLQDGRVYHYAVYALFREPGGRLTASRGVGLSAVPGEPAGPVTDLRAESRPDGVVDLVWTPQAVGRVRILRSGLPLAWVAGERRDESELERVEGDWIEAVGAGRAHDTARDEGTVVRIYTPVTFQDGSAVIGAAAEHAHLVDPAGFRAMRDWENSTRIVARFRPLEDVNTSYRIVARADRWPDGPDDSRAVRVEVDRGAMRERGFVGMDLPADRAEREWYVVAYAAVTRGGSLWTSGGETARAVVPGGPSRALVWYRLSSQSGGKRWTITLRTEPVGSSFGPTVLVAAPRLLPLKVTEGQSVAKFPAGRDGDRHEFAANGFTPGRRVRLFADPEGRPGGTIGERLYLPEESG